MKYVHILGLCIIYYWVYVNYLQKRFSLIRLELDRLDQIKLGAIVTRTMLNNFKEKVQMLSFIQSSTFIQVKYKSIYLTNICRIFKKKA